MSRTSLNMALRWWKNATDAMKRGTATGKHPPTARQVFNVADVEADDGEEADSGGEVALDVFGREATKKPGQRVAVSK